MPVDDGVKLRLPPFIALLGKVRGLNQLIGNATEGTYNNNDRLVLCLVLNNVLQAQNALYGTHGRSAEF